MQSTSNFETDPTGHGTDVTGIAAADINNNFGFVGAGGNVSIYAYRVFPTPDDNCVNDNSSDDQCSANTVDIADAIDDAVSQGVNVISMSLGGRRVRNGFDLCPDRRVIADHAKATVVERHRAQRHRRCRVRQLAAVRACGTGLRAPGVIAVGATALSDGAANPNGTGITSGPRRHR